MPVGYLILALAPAAIYWGAATLWRLLPDEDSDDSLLR